MPSARRSARTLRREHRDLCFARAFPVSRQQYRAARAGLAATSARVAALPRRQHHELDDSGLAATPVHYPFSFDVARWLARRAAGRVRIDWGRTGDTTRLDDLLRLVLQAGEDEYFDSGYVSSRDWIELARRGTPGTDFDWLMAQLRDPGRRDVFRELYDAAELALTWDLADSPYSKSRNTLAVAPVLRAEGLRRRPRRPQQEIRRPLGSLRKVAARRGARLIDIAMASLAVRHRETYHFNFANPAEVYVADVGGGVSIAVFGLLPEYRFALECTMGYLILANGVPIGYGGSSVLFRQVNTGINIFDEYRGSEASFLWSQVMRVYHALTGCTRFIANAYQFGGDNSEALQSGAFWFYYRLGYRPMDRQVRAVAAREFARKRRDASYRSDTAALRRLSGCDMQLLLPGSRQAEWFDEEWLVTSSMLASRELGAQPARRHADAARKLAEQLARQLGIRGMQGWSRNERRAFTRMAPFIASANPGDWPDADRRSMRDIARAKGGACEAHFARLLGDHGLFLAALRKACRRAESS
jgi:hypothetical protein